MNEFAEILNLFIANVIAYTFFAAVYGFIIYNAGKIIFTLFVMRYTIFAVTSINTNPIKINSNTGQGGRDFSAACFVERTIS